LESIPARKNFPISVHDPPGNEAQKIADRYQRIIRAIERQIDEQGGW
jgi:hypothetical protein